jgi:hypothetical protein
MHISDARDRCGARTIIEPQPALWDDSYCPPRPRNRPFRFPLTFGHSLDGSKAGKRGDGMARSTCPAAPMGKGCLAFAVHADAPAWPVGSAIAACRWADVRGLSALAIAAMFVALWMPPHSAR